MKTQRPYIRKRNITKFDKAVNMPPSVPTASDLEEAEGATSRPDKAYPELSSQLRRGGTSAPEIGVPDSGADELEQEYAENYAGLIDKYLLSHMRIDFVFIISGIAFFFVSDNLTGGLKNVSDVLWTTGKCVIFSAFVIIIRFLYWVCGLLKERFFKQ